jgi:hypothetical protein
MRAPLPLSRSLETVADLRWRATCASISTTTSARPIRANEERANRVAAWETCPSVPQKKTRRMAGLGTQFLKVRSSKRLNGFCR